MDITFLSTLLPVLLNTILTKAAEKSGEKFAEKITTTEFLKKVKSIFIEEDSDENKAIVSKIDNRTPLTELETKHVENTFEKKTEQISGLYNELQFSEIDKVDMEKDIELIKIISNNINLLKEKYINVTALTDINFLEEKIENQEYKRKKIYEDLQKKMIKYI